MLLGSSKSAVQCFVGVGAVDSHASKQAMGATANQVSTTFALHPDDTHFTFTISDQIQVDQPPLEIAAHGITLWNEGEAKSRLRTSSHANAYSRLALFYHPQACRTYCGFASMAMALNVLRPVITAKPSRPSIHEDLVLKINPHQK